MKYKVLLIFVVLFYSVIGSAAKLQVDNAVMEPGSTKVINISLTSVVTEIVGVQFDVALPAGFSLGATDEKGYQLSSDQPDDMTCSVSEIGTNVFRFVLYSSALQKVKAGELMSINLKAGSGTAIGNYFVKISNIAFSDSDGGVTKESEVSANIKLTRIYTLLYKVDGELYKQYEFEVGDKISPEPEPTREGYTFSGWSDIPETMPAEDVTVTGTFTIGTFKLTYYFDGEVYQAFNYTFGTTITPISGPTISASSGYTFSGWSEIPETMPGHDVDVIGTSVPKQYTLTYRVFDAEAMSYFNYKSYTVAFGTTITPEPAYSKEGYTFEGWKDLPETMPAKNLMITGRLTINSYTLSYMLDDNVYKSYKKKFGASITPETAPVRDGFTFAGWSDVPATMPARDVTITGSFTKNPVTNVSYPTEWDMSGWSDETLSNLDADPKWSEYENKYRYNGSCPQNEAIELTANGEKIKETAGIEFAVNNCTIFYISTKSGGGYEVNIHVYKPSGFFFVLKNLKRGQKVTLDLGSVDWYSGDDGYPTSDSAVKMISNAKTRGNVSAVTEYVVSQDGDVRFNVNTDTFFYLYDVKVSEVSDALLTYLGNPEGINNVIDCDIYWNGTMSSIIVGSYSQYSRGADVKIKNNSSNTMTITKIVMYDGTTSIGTLTDQNGDLDPGDAKEFSISISSKNDPPSNLPWMEVYYTLNGVPYIKKFEPSETTAIDAVRIDSDNAELGDIYTMDGKKLNAYPTQKGVYIKNGKKFVVK